MDSYRYRHECDTYISLHVVNDNQFENLVIEQKVTTKEYVAQQQGSSIQGGFDAV